MDSRVAESLDSVRKAFAPRPVPVDAPYCFHCKPEEEVRRMMSTRPENLSEEDLWSIIWDAYYTGVDWPSLAYFIPHNLELYAKKRGPDNEMLLAKLHMASRPGVSAFVDEVMTDSERRAVFHCITTILEVQVESKPYDHIWDPTVAQVVGFLASFDEPIQPFLNRWMRSEVPLARANLCVLISRCTLANGPYWHALENNYGEKARPLSTNQDALDEILDPRFVAEYLLENSEAVKLLGPELTYEVDLAFSAAVSESRF